MDAERAERQLEMIAGVVAMSERLGVQIWLRGGWAVDFFLGRVTRDHVDIDWDAWIDDAPAITAGLHADGYQTTPGPPPDQQLDVVRDGEEMSVGWLARGPGGEATIAGGRFAGEPWPNAVPGERPGRIGSVQCPIMSPEAQIESKEMMPVWVPGRPRRPKDAADIALLRQALLDQAGGADRR